MLERVSDEQLRKAVIKYFNAVKERSAKNTETSYNRPIIELVELFGCKPVDFSGERSGIAGENIDIKIWRADEDLNKTEPFAAIEVKKIGGIDERARSQIKTEASRYGNVILTDNTEWRFYGADGKMYNGFELIKKDGTELKLDEEKIELFIQSIKSFVLADPVNIRSSGKLAEYMATYARDIRVIINGILQTDSSKPMFNELFALYSRLKQELLPELNIEEFADMYAQTIVYGLFIARYNDKDLKTFTLGEAIANLSQESHLLKQFFQHITTSSNIHPTLKNVVEKLCKLFSISNLPELLDECSKKDTIIHFYEDFLSYYDMAKRKAFGAYYTPYQVVRYMVSMVDEILVNEFKVNGGLSNNETTNITVKCDEYQFKKNDWRKEKEISVPQVAILDPACGTGTFGAEIIKFIKEKYFSGGNSAFYKKWIQDKNGLLSRLIGFEIMMTSYVVAHLKIRRTIAETLGEQPDEILPSNIFLTNTLAEPKSLIEKNQQQSFFDFSGAITEEAENADKWKSRRPIKVIIGNPPYLAASKNPFDITAYKTETDGVTDFKERKHWLNDDYVKFIRFAEQRIEKDGSGILAFISNNGYLDNQTFRGMRASLLRTFDKIFILDLHGNAVKKETAPDGSKDENVFDIQQGVGIIIGIKTTRNKDWAKVYHADLFGTRENKFSALDKKNIVFKKLDIDTKMAYFIPQNETGKDTYEDGVNISELFLTNVTGVMSGNNDISLASTEKELRKRIDIVNNALNEEPIQKLWGSFSRGQTADKIQKDLLDKEGKITPIAFRPFEDKWTYYSGTSCGWLLWAREKKTMGQLVHSSTSPIGKNIAFIYGRAAHISNDFAMVFVSDKIIDKGLLDVVHQAYISPLYNAPSGLEKEWTPNFNKEQLDKLTQNLKNKPTPIEIFDYCYGVLYDPTYREKYNEFLKRDFPRVPVIENEKTFDKYKNIGKLLRELHLMQTEAKFNLVITGTNLKIDLVKYTNGKLHINKETTIAGIPQNVWNYFIGGYQVLDKWFKSHKGEELDIGKFNHIQKVVGILAETIKLQDVLR